MSGASVICCICRLPKRIMATSNDSLRPVFVRCFRGRYLVGGIKIID